MKKMIIMALVALFAGMMMGCEKETRSVCSIEYSQFSRYGTIHNQYLAYTLEFFDGDEKVDSLADCISYLVSFDKSYAQVILSDTTEIVEMDSCFNKYKNYYISSYLYTDVYVDNVIDPIISQLIEYDIIGEKDSLILENLLTIGLLQKEGKISIYEYQEAINELVEEWETCNSRGMVSIMTAIVLNIASSSVQWWISNPEETKVAPWVASDAVGAVYGATVAGVSSYVQNGQVNWVSVGVGAVSGAVTGSTGVIGKVGRWISKVIK